MESGLILPCEVPKNIKILRNLFDEHTNIPSHISLCYLNKESIDTNVLKKINSFKITLNKIEFKEDIIYLGLKNDKILKSILDPLKDDILKLPKSGFHLTIAYKRDGQILNLTPLEKELISKKISLPINIKINKVWLMKRDKKKNRDWFRSKTFFLNDNKYLSES